MSNADDLAEVNTAITAALNAKSFTHNGDSKTNQDLDKLYDLKERIQGKIARAGKGPRVTGIRLRHGS